MTFVRIPLESRLLLLAASLFIPRTQRMDWRMEWDGEVWWWITSQPEAGRSVRERLALAVHCAGAISDGFCLWLEDEDLLAGLHAVLRGPQACLAAGVLLIAIVGSLSGVFETTRRCLQATFRPRNPELAILSQTGPFMGKRYGVPPLKVAYWDLHSGSLQGADAYWFYRSVGGSDSSQRSDVLAAKVGARFFRLMGTKPSMGRVFGQDDLESCRSCAVIGYEFWKQRLGADPGIIGRTIAVDNRPFRVIGVLRKDFWFPGEPAMVWSLFDAAAWRDFPIAATGAICRLRQGISPAAAEQELRRLAREVVPRQSGTEVTVDPLDSIVSRPVTSIGPFLIAFALAVLVCALSGWIARGEIFAGVFWLAKTSLFASAIFLAAFEFGGAASVTGNGGTTTSAAMAIWWLLVAGGLLLRWAWNDQRKRCRECLSRLVLPLRIGEGSRMLLEPGGTEMTCSHGHGVLFTAEGDSIAPRDRWYRLDDSWRQLAAPGAHTIR